MKNKTKVAVLIPAHNEEKVIKKTLDAVLKMVDNSNLYIVDDGSSDKTFQIAKKYTKNILAQESRGKAIALNIGIKHFKLTTKYEFILFMDADSSPKSDFIDVSLKHFVNDKKNEVACVSGRVKGIGSSWISKYRQWEYQISYLIHKRAQQHISSILVAPGCATLYRSSVFEKLGFPTGTLTEDMDFTFLMHRKNYKKMIFDNKAIVYTIDPEKITDFSKQLSRWYTGFWQVVRKHDIPWRGQMLDLEVAMLATEGLYNGLLVCFFIFSLFSLIIYNKLSVLLVPFLFDLFLFFIPTLIWSSISDKDFSRIFFIPHFYFLRLLSSLIFLKSYFAGYLSTEKEYIWSSNRYLGKEVK